METIKIKSEMEDSNELWGHEFSMKTAVEADVAADPTTGEMCHKYKGFEAFMKVVRDTQTQEDLLRVRYQYLSLSNGEYIKETVWPRDVALEADLKQFWPNYSPEMPREVLNKLPEIAINDVDIRLGIYRVTDEEGKPVYGEDGKPLIQQGTKWFRLELADKTKFTLSGDKRKYVERKKGDK